MFLPQRFDSCAQSGPNYDMATVIARSHRKRRATVFPAMHSPSFGLVLSKDAGRVMRGSGRELPKRAFFSEGVLAQAALIRLTSKRAN